MKRKIAPAPICFIHNCPSRLPLDGIINGVTYAILGCSVEGRVVYTPLPASDAAQCPTDHVASWLTCIDWAFTSSGGVGGKGVSSASAEKEELIVFSSAEGDRKLFA